MMISQLFTWLCLKHPCHSWTKEIFEFSVFFLLQFFFHWTTSAVDYIGVYAQYYSRLHIVFECNSLIDASSWCTVRPAPAAFAFLPACPFLTFAYKYSVSKKLVTKTYFGTVNLHRLIRPHQLTAWHQAFKYIYVSAWLHLDMCAVIKKYLVTSFFSSSVILAWFWWNLASGVLN